MSEHTNIIRSWTQVMLQSIIDKQSTDPIKQKRQSF